MTRCGQCGKEADSSTMTPVWDGCAADSYEICRECQIKNTAASSDYKDAQELHGGYNEDGSKKVIQITANATYIDGARHPWPSFLEKTQ